MNQYLFTQLPVQNPDGLLYLASFIVIFIVFVGIVMRFFIKEKNEK